MNEWVWSDGGMILTGENWSTGRKTLYSVGGRWMNEYGAMVEWYWQGKTEVLGEKHYTAWVIDEWMSMEQWYWQGKAEVLGEKHYTAWVVDEWMSMEQWWNVTGENWNTGRKTLYSVSGRWMNDYGAMVERYRQGKFRNTGRKPCPCKILFTTNLTQFGLGSNPDLCV